MPFIITPLKEKDTLEWCQAHYAAFAPLLGCLWKYPPTEETYAFMAQQRAVTLSDPHTHVMKVVETESGKIAGVATWKIYPHERTQKELEKSLEDGPYADDINIEARVAFMTNLYNKRKSTLGTRPCVLLGSLIVRPEFQRQGVGHLLMEWGCGEADKRGLMGYLESSKNGLVLYKRFGYEPHSELFFDTTPYGGPGIDKHTIMFRQPKQLSE